MTAPTRTELKATADAYNDAQTDAALETTTYSELRAAAAQGQHSATVQLGAAQAPRFLSACAAGGLSVSDTAPESADLKTFLVSWN